jgi:putative hydrolases of HD superfamily
MKQSTSTKVRTDNLLQLSALVKKFMTIKRATIMDGRFETDGEHTLHLQMLAVSYAAEYHPELDTGKIALYCMVHDFVEVYANDTATLTASHDQISEKYAREAAALVLLEKELEDIWPYFISLMQSYETLADPEARFVRCFDKCDPAFSHLANRGEALIRLGVLDKKEYTRLNSVVKKRIEHYSDGFEDVLKIRGELQDRVADRAYGTV